MKSDFSKILATVDKMSTKFEDAGNQGYWKLEQDKVGNGSAVIRFLPERDGSVPFVRLYTHGFKNDKTGKYFIDNCPSTLDNECPVCASNGVLWNEDGSDAAKKLVRERKRKLNYIANILVISDPKNPDNDGKVFKFKFGKKIFDKIVDKLKPAFEDMTPMNPFCPKEGANFKLRVQKVDNWPNYDKSEFAESTPIAKTDKAIDAILENMYDLEAEIAPDRFKSYDQLEARFNQVVSGKAPAKAAQPSTGDDEDLPFESSSEPQFVEKKPARPLPAKVNLDDEDDDEAYFRNLASS